MKNKTKRIKKQESLCIDNNTGEIYTMNPLTGEVLADTGTSCNNGVANKVYLANAPDVVCSGVEVTRYTNGAFAIGGTLYTDASLTTPVTGYSYVLWHSGNDHIYNLNSVTGVIGSDTGLTCGAYSGSFRRSNTAIGTCSAGYETLYSASPFAAGVTMYTDAALTTLATGYSYIEKNGDIYNINSLTAVVGAFDSICP